MFSFFLPDRRRALVAVPALAIVMALVLWQGVAWADDPPSPTAATEAIPEEVDAVETPETAPAETETVTEAIVGEAETAADAVAEAETVAGAVAEAETAADPETVSGSETVAEASGAAETVAEAMVAEGENAADAVAEAETVAGAVADAEAVADAVPVPEVLADTTDQGETVVGAMVAEADNATGGVAEVDNATEAVAEAETVAEAGAVATVAGLQKVREQGAGGAAIEGSVDETAESVTSESARSATSLERVVGAEAGVPGVATKPLEEAVPTVAPEPVAAAVEPTAQSAGPGIAHVVAELREGPAVAGHVAGLASDAGDATQERTATITPASNIEVTPASDEASVLRPDAEPAGPIIDLTSASLTSAAHEIVGSHPGTSGAGEAASAPSSQASSAGTVVQSSSAGTDVRSSSAGSVVESSSSGTLVQSSSAGEGEGAIAPRFVSEATHIPAAAATLVSATTTSLPDRPRDPASNETIFVRRDLLRPFLIAGPEAGTEPEAGTGAASSELGELQDPYFGWSPGWLPFTGAMLLVPLLAAAMLLMTSGGAAGWYGSRARVD